MNIGLLKEIKTFENRIMLVPESVKELVEQGNTIYFESGAGEASGFDDKSYESAGAQVLPSSEKVFNKVELVLKIQAPMPIEHELITDKHICFCYLAPQNNPERLQSLIKSSAIYLSAELIHPVKDVMSEIAGKVAIIQAQKYLERHFGGKGILFSGACEIPGARVTIIGSNASAFAATNQALLLGSSVNLICENYQNLVAFKVNHHSDLLNIFEFDRSILQNILMETDVLIINGQGPDKKINLHIVNDDLKLLQTGSLIIDLSVNNGDIIESSRETKPDGPIYLKDGLVYFTVSNLPSFVPKTSSYILSNITSKYIGLLTKMGFEEAIATSPELRDSLVLYRGKIVNPILAESNESEPYDILELLELNI
jgi:alanine dehydrogenase